MLYLLLPKVPFLFIYFLCSISEAMEGRELCELHFMIKQKDNVPIVVGCFCAYALARLIRVVQTSVQTNK